MYGFSVEYNTNILMYNTFFNVDCRYITNKIPRLPQRKNIYVNSENSLSPKIKNK